MQPRENHELGGPADLGRLGHAGEAVRARRAPSVTQHLAERRRRRDWPSQQTASGEGREIEVFLMCRPPPVTRWAVQGARGVRCEGHGVSIRVA
jgi:hypothetical protein